MQLKDKTAIVTGAASGIGKEIARAVRRRAGAKVAIADPQPRCGPAAAAELDATRRSTLAIRMDVTDEAQVDAGVDEVCRRFGGVDVLVSNAGIQIVAPVDQFQFSDWKKMLAIHLDGAFLTTRACLRHMYSQRPRRHDPLHRFGPFEGGLEAQGALRGRQARADRPGQDRRQGRRPTWRPRQRHLPGVRPHSARREADSRAGEGARHQRGGRDQDGHAEGDGGRGVHHASTTSPAAPSSSPASRPTRSPASRSSSAMAGRCNEPRHAQPYKDRSNDMPFSRARLRDSHCRRRGRRSTASPAPAGRRRARRLSGRASTRRWPRRTCTRTGSPEYRSARSTPP